MKSFAKEKLVTKHIEWEEAYTEKTEFLKEQFEAVIGPGSYFRFEGKDYKTGDEYYVILGPAKIHNPRAKFFAGVRKLPATYSAGGKYFDSMDGAASYARETWGVSTPASLKPYTSASLYQIADKIEEWKKKKEHRQERELERSKDNDDREDEDVKNKKEGTKMVSFNLSTFIKESMGAERWKSRTIREADYNWWSYEDILAGGDDAWKEVVATEPKTAQILVDDCRKLKAQKDAEINHVYGITSPHFFMLYIGYNMTAGGYIVSIGPYLNLKPNAKEEAKDRFYIGTLFKRWATAEQIASSIKRAIKKYSTIYGDAAQLDASDFKYILKKSDPEKVKGKGSVKTIAEFDGDKLDQLDKLMVDEKGVPIKQMEGAGSEIGLNSKGFAKVLATVPFFKGLASQLDQTIDQIVADPSALKKLYNVQVKKYKDALANKSADLLDMIPPPPFPSAAGQTSGQQVPRVVSPLNAVKYTDQQYEQLSDAEKQRIKSITDAGSNLTLGFESFKDALMAASLQYTGLRKYLAQIPDDQDVTSKQLSELRLLKNPDSATPQPEVAKAEEVEKELGKLPPKKTPVTEEVTEDVSQPIAETPEVPEKHKDFEEFEGLFGNALKSLMKISSELDSEGKTSAAEEVHEIVRKYIRR